MEDKKETFFYNQSKEPDPDYRGHFFVTQLQTLLVAVLVTGLMQYSNHLAIYLIYCCPFYFFLVLLEFFIFWKSEDDLTTYFNVWNIFTFVVCLPIFFGVFFGVFHPTASLEFTQVQNCQLIGSFSNSIEGYEKYQILYINFEHEGQEYLGAACSSDQTNGATSNDIDPFKFIYKYDSVKCGSSNSNSTGTQNGRLLFENTSSSYYKNSTERILRVGGGGGGGSSGGGSRSSGGRSSISSGRSSRSTTTCHRDYLWSKVKIASWLCMDRGFDLEQMMSKQTCYMNFFSGNTAIQNGIARAPMKDQYNFPLISYQKEAYYPKADLICLILLAYYPWILSFNLIFQYTSNCILKSLRIRSNERQTAVQDFIVPPPNPPPPAAVNENNNIELENVQNIFGQTQEETTGSQPNVIPMILPEKVKHQTDDNFQLKQNKEFHYGQTTPKLQFNQNNEFENQDRFPQNVYIILPNQQNNNNNNNEDNIILPNPLL